MHEKKNYVIWGSSGHAKVLANLLALRSGRVVALFDRNSAARSVLAGVPLHIGLEGFSKWVENEWDHNETFGLAAIGGAHGRDRLEVQHVFRTHGIKVDPIVHPDASVCATALLGSGTQILAQATVSSDTQVGEGCIINHGAVADHECKLDDGVHLGPASTLCGCVHIGKNVFVGAGAVILPRVSIGHDTVIGAGAVVTKDVPAGVTAIGCPAKPA